MTKEKFLSLILKTETCWLWQGACTPDGYGYSCLGKRVLKAHRRAYDLLVRPLKRNEHLHHKCKNKLCVNPDHLEVMTEENHSDNITVINKNKTHCKNGHELSGSNLYIRPDGKGRECTFCRANTTMLHHSNKRRTNN